MFQSLIDALFGCSHQRTTFPLTPARRNGGPAFSGAPTYVTCLDCGKRYGRDAVQARLPKEEHAPRCEACGGILKPATISFGQAMPERETTEAYRRSESCDLFIVVGSSLVVHPAAAMPVVAKRAGAKLVIVNRDQTACDNVADLIIHDQAGPVMAAILTHVKQLLGGVTH